MLKKPNHHPLVNNIHQQLNTMKNIILIAALICGIGFMSACSGNNSSKNSKDTVVNTYKTPKDTSKMDTSKVSSADNTATGGAGNTVDTVKAGKEKK